MTVKKAIKILKTSLKNIDKTNLDIRATFYSPFLDGAYFKYCYGEDECLLDGYIAPDELLALAYCIKYSLWDRI